MECHLVSFVVLLSLCALAKGDPDGGGGTLPVCIFVGSAGFSAFFITLIYCYCTRKRTPKNLTSTEGFAKITNEREEEPYREYFRSEKPSRGHFRSEKPSREHFRSEKRSRVKTKRLSSGKNRRQNFVENALESKHSTHVVIQPVVNLRLAPGEQKNDAIFYEEGCTLTPDAPPRSYGSVGLNN